jgi:hypothetical protein
MDVVVIIICVALVLIGVVLVVRDGHSVALERSWPSFLARLFAAGAVGGVLATGAGGRLVMALLALSSPGSHGMLTEAEARIGEVTASGTLGFMVFVGLPAGVLSAALFALASPALPRGRLGGTVLGLVLLVLAGSLIDPLRSDNFDFALVGPDWLSVLAFVALAAFQGLVTHSLALRAGLPRTPPRMITIRALVLVVATLAALPSFLLAVASILTSG